MLCDTAILPINNNVCPFLRSMRTYDDVRLPVGRLCDRLRHEQSSYFYTSKTLVVAK